MRSAIKIGLAICLLIGSATTLGAGPALVTEAEYGDVNSVKALLDQGTQVDVADQNGQTALMIAANMGKLDVAQLLLDRGANSNARDKNGKTPLMHGATTAQAAVLQLLINRGADVKAKAPRDRTALIFAAEGAGPLDVRMLLADLEGRPKVKPQPGNLVETITILLDAGLDPNARLGGSDFTPVEMQGVSNDPAAMRLLLERGATVKPSSGPLISMARKNSPETVLLLLQRGANVNAHGPTDIGWSVLMTASANNDATMVRVLLEHGADVNYQNRAGYNALNRAPGDCQSEVVLLLIKAGASGRC